MADDNTYSPSITAAKAALPLFIIAIVEAAYAALTAKGIAIDKALLYQVAVGGYAAIIGFVNWLKNRNKKA